MRGVQDDCSKELQDIAAARYESKTAVANACAVTRLLCSTRLSTDLHFCHSVVIEAEQ